MRDIGFNIRDWLMPVVAFVLFLYFMMFLILYTVKISGSDVSLHGGGGEGRELPKRNIERYLGDISKTFKEGY